MLSRFLRVLLAVDSLGIVLGFQFLPLRLSVLDDELHHLLGAFLLLLRAVRAPGLQGVRQMTWKRPMVNHMPSKVYPPIHNYKTKNCVENVFVSWISLMKNCLVS